MTKASTNDLETLGCMCTTAKPTTLIIIARLFFYYSEQSFKHCTYWSVSFILRHTQMTLDTIHLVLANNTDRVIVTTKEIPSAKYPILRL